MAHRVNDGRYALLRVALEQDALAAGTEHAGVGEGERVAIRISHADQLACARVDVVGNAVLGGDAKLPPKGVVSRVKGNAGRDDVFAVNLEHDEVAAQPGNGETVGDSGLSVEGRDVKAITCPEPAKRVA